MRPQRLSQRKERYSCGPASTCAQREVCVCVCLAVRVDLCVLESNCAHAATVTAIKNKLYVEHYRRVRMKHDFIRTPKNRI